MASLTSTASSPWARFVSLTTSSLRPISRRSRCRLLPWVKCCAAKFLIPPEIELVIESEFLICHEEARAIPGDGSVFDEGVHIPKGSIRSGPFFTWRHRRLPDDLLRDGRNIWHGLGMPVTSPVTFEISRWLTEMGRPMCVPSRLASLRRLPPRRRRAPCLDQPRPFLPHLGEIAHLHVAVTANLLRQRGERDRERDDCLK